MTEQRPFLRIACEEWVPWTKLVRAQDGTLSIVGPMGNFLQVLSTVLRFDYELTQSPEKVWGGPNENGDWNGMLGMLQREEVEFAVGPFTVTPQRETVSDLTYPLSGADKAILLARPKLDTDVAGFVKAFTYETWLLTLLFAIVTIIVTILLVRAENALFGTPVKDLGSKVTLWVLKAFTQESSTWLPENDAGRLLVTTWLLASLVFMSSYSGILTAMLTLPRVVIPINSIYDMVGQSDIPWRLEAGSSMFQYFKEATDGVRREVFMGMSGTFQDCWAARQEIVNGEFAAICDIITMKKAMAWDFSTSGDCHLYIAREMVYSSAWVAVAFKRNSSYFEPANDVIRGLLEAGLVDQWLREVIAVTPQCLQPPSADRTDGVSPLDLKSFGGPLLVLLGGELARGRMSLTYSLSFCSAVMSCSYTHQNSFTTFPFILNCFKRGVLRHLIK
ncbi:glutamate receptor ionotropic, delta-1-like isoform X1 [Scylla paramamosain]|uniref:glutamate receptor ionotropic, delta-1-like isoform X1 n=1 Tax=Scylla paramamosain TaxID=85552 RepID=UPI0030834044